MKKGLLEREMTLEVIVGTFMFLILLVVAYFTIILSRERLFQKTYPFEAVFENVMGLRKGDNVVVRGMTIGKIKDTRLAGDGVHVLCALDNPVSLRKDGRVVIRETSVLGGRMLEIEEGTRGSEPYPEGVQIRGKEPIDLLGEASAVARDIRVSLTKGKILENLENTMRDARQIADKINRGEGTIGKLLTDDSAYQDIRAITADGKVAMAQIRQLTEKIGQGDGTIGKLLTDETVYTNISSLVTNLQVFSEKLAQGQGLIGKLMSDESPLYSDFESAAASLKTVASRLEQGEGTLGKIMKDDDLYREVKQAITDVRAAVDDFRETAPILSFSSLLFGAF